ncbi:monosaccharide ABC transporter substrate-binding protein, CUT2 family [Candidatus Koribacter versatilis Ellin345]|uniref:Monosaccharide ABC transporter substrate-binding protein, CUT2 family n=1 Tax=Koribacter versatilis (strain Ellin345) TaxID=204669 RepID=Q1IJE4_KORVE|nr:substrate-binding domain-containing protein [Candidatus Koribacter versatilis]ABF43006.1 monosaccharide ABC transporter substrate-binding protein, CUT2 family [Candidatus Koribacter versatilis Ellin345]
MSAPKKIALTLIAAASCLLAGCAKHDNDEKYILVTVNSKVEYWKTAQAGLTKAAAQYGVKWDVRGPENYDPQAEVQEFRNAAAQKPSGILVSVADASLMQPAIDEAINAGIPVLTIDSDAPKSKRLYFIGTNNRQAGTLGAKRLVEKLHGKGNVVFFTMPQPNLDERLAGYKDVLSDNPGIKIVEVVNIKGDSGNAFDRTAHYAGAKDAQKIDAFVCLEATSAKDVALALKRENVTDRLVIAMDVDPATLDLIKSGVVDATIAQKPYTMAFYGLKALDEIHHGKPDLTKDYSFDSFSPFPAFVDTGTSVVDKTNVDLYLQARAANAK